ICLGEEAEPRLRQPHAGRDHGAGRHLLAGARALLSRRGARRLVSGGLSLARVRWPKACRIIRSIYPPIDLFEDIADPQDWEALASAESKTNPRLWEHIGRLDLVPPARRVGGPGASYLMAPFVHISTDRPGRFTDGTYGVYSAGDREEVAIREVAHHHGRAMANSGEEPGWTSQFRMLVGRLDR